MMKKMIVDRAILLQKKVGSQAARWYRRARLLRPGAGAALPTGMAPHSALLHPTRADGTGHWG